MGNSRLTVAHYVSKCSLTGSTLTFLLFCQYGVSGGGASTPSCFGKMKWEYSQQDGKSRMEFRTQVPDWCHLILQFTVITSAASRGARRQ